MKKTENIRIVPEKVYNLKDTNSHYLSASIMLNDRKITTINIKNNVSTIKKIEYKIVPIDKFHGDLESFKCTRDPDLSEFLHKYALKEHESRTTRTYIVSNSENKILGYYSLRIVCSNSKSFNAPTKAYFEADVNSRDYYPVYELLMIAKNSESDIVMGNIFKKHIMFQIKMASNIVGGCYLYLECSDTKELIKYYEKLGFLLIGSFPGRANSKMAKMAQIIVFK